MCVCVRNVESECVCVGGGGGTRFALFDHKPAIEQIMVRVIVRIRVGLGEYSSLIVKGFITVLT